MNESSGEHSSGKALTLDDGAEFFRACPSRRRGGDPVGIVVLATGSTD